MPSKLAFINEGFCRIASFLEKSLCRVFTYPPVPTVINGGFFAGTTQIFTNERRKHLL